VGAQDLVTPSRSGDRDFRLLWAEKIGLGFDLPGATNGQLGQLLQFRKAVYLTEEIGGRHGTRTHGLLVANYVGGLGADEID
jgi:hypothetical protein